MDERPVYAADDELKQSVPELQRPSAPLVLHRDVKVSDVGRLMNKVGLVFKKNPWMSVAHLNKELAYRVNNVGFTLATMNQN